MKESFRWAQYPDQEQLSFLQVVLVALRQARPRGADGMGRPARALRRSTRRYSSQRDEFHRMELPRPAINPMYSPGELFLAGRGRSFILRGMRARATGVKTDNQGTSEPPTDGPRCGTGALQTRPQDAPLMTEIGMAAKRHKRRKPIQLLCLLRLFAALPSGFATGAQSI